jgi:2-dehydro-3-deoxygalactonokinase
VSIACIAVDWGTSNRRAWALDASGAVLQARSDDQGLIAIGAGGDFAGSLKSFLEGWLTGAPVVMAGMVGSRAGWREAPYLETPARLDDLAAHLIPVTGIEGTEIRIVPGMARRGAAQPDVMRGEECQLLGAKLVPGIEDGIFLLPGTHAKWARVEDGRLTDFRTYMTGEIFGLLARQGSLSQVINQGAIGSADFDAAAFARGLARSQGAAPGALTHHLFGVRSLSLFGALDPGNAGSYLSGLLVGAEMTDALAWLRAAGAVDRVTAIGSPGLLTTYAAAAAEFGIHLDRLESADILPPALFALARRAQLC